jgi:RNA polymerase sigma-70 factor (ECF subfamily)
MDRAAHYHWRQLRQGDEQAFKSLFELLWKDLYVYAARLMQSRDEAHDIVQELFIQLWENRYQLAEVDSVKPYLYRSIRNMVLNRIKVSQIRDKHLEAFKDILPTTGNTTEEMVLGAEAHTNLMKSLELLPERMREIFYMNRIDHVPVSTIADQLNLSEQTVRNQINLASKRLKELTIMLVSLFIS